MIIQYYDRKEGKIKDAKEIIKLANFRIDVITDGDEIIVTIVDLGEKNDSRNP